MNVLNKEVFNQTKKVLGLIVSNKLVNGFSKQFKSYMFQSPKFKPIVSTDTDDKKMIYLCDTLKKETDIPDQLKTFIKENDIKVIEKDISLNYNNFSYEQVLKTLLPKDVGIPFSFERIGHIIHVNLKDEQLPFKYIIGQAILDKNIQVKTVLNKVGEIDTVFRTFKIEILAGEPDLVAEIKENECIFRFNFEEVYWNSRLQYEHMELVNTFKKEDIICDMFAGVGPFALPAAKIKKCKVYANDLNPSSVKYMKENAKTNRLESKVEISNLDARDFVKSLVEKSIPFTHVVMNLPSTSIEFLDVFRDIFLNSTIPPPIPPPIINCYTFTKLDESSDLIKDTIKNVENVIGAKVPSDCVCYEVRDVAPKKSMMRITFRMPTILPYVGPLTTASASTSTPTPTTNTSTSTTTSTTSTATESTESTNTNTSTNNVEDKNNKKRNSTEDSNETNETDSIDTNKKLKN
ncbi:hypothetical protein ACTFIW_006760 [Dictyostelium discoideum]